MNPLPAARALLDVRKARSIVRPLGDLAPRTEADGAAIQFALAGLVGATRPAGFKIGATGSRMQAYLGIDAPIGGFMRAEDVHRNHADLRFADFVRPGVECEVAVRLRHDLPPGPCTRAQATAAIGSFFAGIEVVENRYGDVRALGSPMLVADQMYHCAAVIGDPVDGDWRDLPIDALSGRIQLDVGTFDQGITSDLLGHPLVGLAWLASAPLAAAFGGLRAGQIIMLGSVTPPLWLSGPATATVCFPPLPSVTVCLG